MGTDRQVEVDGRELKLTNLDKVLYPEVGFTKGEMVDYYAKVVYLAAHYGGAKEFNAEQIDKLLEVRRTKFAQPGRHPFLQGTDLTN